jgi:hypothetical protein
MNTASFIGGLNPISRRLIKRSARVVEEPSKATPTLLPRPNLLYYTNFRMKFQMKSGLFSNFLCLLGEYLILAAC